MKKTFTFLLFILVTLTGFAAAPTVAATNLNASTAEGNNIYFTWKNGNGAKRIVIARKSEPVTALPVNGVNYAASPVFGNGNEIAPGQFVVFNGSYSAFTLTGLNTNTTYYLAIFEYNGEDFLAEYLTTTSLSGSGKTIAAPTIQPGAITISAISGNSMKLSYAAGNGAGRIILAKAGGPVDANPIDLTVYYPNASFGIGTQIGNGNFVVGRDNNTSTTVTNLMPDTKYYFAAFEYNGGLGPAYFTINPPTINATTLPRPVTAASNFKTSSIEGNKFMLSWTNGSGARRIVIAKANAAVTAKPVDAMSYSADKIFSKGAEIAPGEYVVYNGSDNYFSLEGLSTGNTYYFAVFEYDGIDNKTAYKTDQFLTGSQATVVAPNIQASAISVSNISNSTATVSFNKGNGTRRIVVMKKGNEVDALPVIYNPPYVGKDLGNGNTVVYFGDGASAGLSSLLPGTTYAVKVFEYNGELGPVYLTSNPPSATFSTSSKPSKQSTGLYFRNNEPNQVDIAWNAGDGQKRIVVASTHPVTGVPVDGVEYAASNQFGLGSTVADGEYVVYNDSYFYTNVYNLVPGNTYYFAVFEYNGTGANTAYLTTNPATNSKKLVAAPTVAASGIQISNINSNSVHIDFTKGDGSGRIVAIRASAAITGLPVDYKYYFPSSYYGNGNQLSDGSYIVSNSYVNSIDVNNLQPNTKYFVTVYEYNGSSVPIYNTANAATADFTTVAVPTKGATNVRFSELEGNSMKVIWDNGNGRRRIVIAREGSPVTALPDQGISYAASGSFGAGAAVAPGQYVVYNGDYFNFVMSNLKPGTVYYVAVFESDGTGSSTGYQTTQVATGDTSTVSAPTIQSSSLFFSIVGNTNVNVNWTNGNGSSRLLIAKKGSPVDAVPVDLFNYIASGNFGSGTNLGNGNFAVVESSQSYAAVTNLEPGATYYFKLFEYNGNTAPVFLQTNPAEASVTTIGAPQVQTSNLFIEAPIPFSAHLSWKNGSGNKRIVLARKGAPVDGIPVDNANYNANTFYGSGDKIGNSYVVYNGINNNVTVTNLNGGLDYYFAIFEYNDFGNVKLYKTDAPLTGIAKWSLLPLKWIAFNASVNATGVLLNWSVSNEINNRLFEIQKSSDGIRFQTIGSVASKGDSKAVTDYSFNDNNASGNIYYRIKQVDNDGRFTYSKVLQVRTGIKEALQLLGNPVSSVVRFILNANYRNSLAVITDNQGRVVAQKSISANTVQEMNVGNLSAGVYYLTIIHDEGKIKATFIKQ